jgi:hypothetical protein
MITSVTGTTHLFLFLSVCPPRFDNKNFEIENHDINTLFFRIQRRNYDNELVFISAEINVETAAEHGIVVASYSDRMEKCVGQVHNGY